MPYEVRFYKGDYKARQEAANRDGAICYVEHHFNASVRSSADYTVVIVADNASEKSKGWGRDYTRLVSQTFGTRIAGDDGIEVGGYDGRGNANLVHTTMPAILVEPMFCSNPRQADLIRSEHGRDQLARCLADSIRENFPEGGLVAFSVGHKYKTSSPNDRGASLYGGGAEADYAEMVLERAAEILQGGQAQPTAVEAKDIRRFRITDCRIRFADGREMQADEVTGEIEFLEVREVTE